VVTIELQNVVKKFAGIAAVNNISFAVESGQIVSLLGPSGCGKTTTLRLIAGFETPDSGRIAIGGRDMGGRRPYERNVGLLFQDYALFPHMTVEQNIAYGPHYRGMSRAEIPGRVTELLSLTRLRGLESRRPGQLSGGQQQRVALARALATNPEVLLLDEPLSALDAKLRQELRIELKEILSTVGKTTIVVTHDQEEAMSLADQVLVMDRGRIMQRGAPVDIYARPANRFVAEFIGRSNWFTGRLEKRGIGKLRQMVTEDEVALLVAVSDEIPDGPIEVCVRPERIAIIPDDPGFHGGADTTALTGNIVDAALLGAWVHYVVETTSRRRLLVIEKNAGGMPLPMGQRVIARFSPDDCIVLPAAAESEHSRGAASPPIALQTTRKEGRDDHEQFLP
jgi:putative spermidine/putrescine transport system ATP-binding protein/putrescine transport system ATP-binding protein